jgi:ABC-type glycerol-3-phosphate transport system substrate-binding protein
MEKGLPLIDREPFLDVLNEMMAQRGGGDDELPLTPEQVYNKAVQGECVFAITWPSSHFKAEPSDATDHLRITRLPGHPQLYDFGSNEWKERDSTAQQRFDYLGFEGRMAGVARHSLHVSEAIRFVGWLSSFPASRKVSIESSHTAPFRTNHLGNITNWTGDAIADRTATEYFDAMTESNRDRLCFIFPRLIEQPKFISVLSDSIRSALSGQATAADALAQAAAEWTVLIEKHSFAEQKKVVLAGENL